MTIREASCVLDARVLCGEEIAEEELHTACGADLMSDVLAFVKDRAVLLTGMTNVHVIRTCEMLDIICVVFVRGKVPDENLLAMAKSRNIAILSTEHTLFTACGLLYEQGLRGSTHKGEGASS